MSKFSRKEKPENIWEIFGLILFDFNRTEKMDKKLFSWREFFKYYIQGSILIAILWLVFGFLYAWIDIPGKYPNLFEKYYIEDWMQSITLLDRFVLFIIKQYLDLVLGYILGITFCLILGLVRGLVVSLVGGLALGLVGGLVLGFVRGIIVSHVVGLVLGLVKGFVWGLTISTIGIFQYFFEGGENVISYIYWAIGGVVGGVVGGTRFLFYFFHFIYSFVPVSLKRNSYTLDSMVYIPIPQLDLRLLAQAKESPGELLEYSNFLLEERPYQKKLALKIKHRAIATLWKQNPLNPDYFFLPGYREEDEKYRDLFPTKLWYLEAGRIKNQIRSVRKQSNLHLRKNSYLDLKKSLESLLDETRNQGKDWSSDYLDAIKRNISECDVFIQKINEDLKNKEQTCPNGFVDGPPLDSNIQTFLGRDDYKDKLLHEINSSVETPTLFIRGQRRIGKTSLLNYLQELLGGGFYVIYSDMQGYEGESLTVKINSFVKAWEEKDINNLFTVENFNYSNEPLEAWKNVSEFFRNLAKSHGRKIILCFDEYESFHESLQKNQELGKQLISRMRSFTQHQNDVVLLFTGLIDFSDRKDPDMNELSHVRTFKLDYLEKQFIEKLMLNPYEGYTIKFDFPEKVVEEVFYQTQGHPLLVQQIGYKMVEIANQEGRSLFKFKEVKTIIQEVAEDKESKPMQYFWDKFCYKIFDLQKEVLDILDGKTPADTKKIFKLEDYGFIVKEKKKYKIRVPMFETWLKKYARVL